MNQRLLQFLSAENISQAQFADTIGVARASVSHILAGRNKPGFDFIESMSSHFPDLSLEWLINGKGKMYKSAAAPSAPLVAAPSSEVQSVPPVSGFEPVWAGSPATACSSSSPSPRSPKTAENALFSNERESSPAQVSDSSPSRAAHAGRSIERIIVFYDDNTYQELK